MSLKAIEKIRDITRERSIQFKVVLIPTKELVFKELVISNRTEVPDDYMQLINNEEEMWKRTKDFLEERSIEYIDCLPALRQCFEKGKQPYQISSDGHPNAMGHQAIAEKVLSTIRAGSISREPGDG